MLLNANYFIMKVMLNYSFRVKTAGKIVSVEIEEILLMAFSRARMCNDEGTIVEETTFIE